nr:hypothetical protein BaRGS_033597 [Batillaria attramentaria]
MTSMENRHQQELTSMENRHQQELAAIQHQLDANVTSLASSLAHIGQDVTLAWTYAADADEHVVNVEWYYTPKVSQHLQFVPNAGIRLQNVAIADAANGDGIQAQLAAMEAKMASMEKRHQQELAALQHQLDANVTSLTSKLESAAKSVSFHAFLHGGPYSGGDNLTARTVYTNDGGAFSPSTGVFTAPVSGTYIFILNLMTNVV